MVKRSFQAAVRREAEQQELGEDGQLTSQYLEFDLAGQEFQAKPISSGQATLIIGSRGETDSVFIATIFDLLRNTLVGDGYPRLRKLLADDVIGFDVLWGGNDENPDGGIVEYLISESAARPTQEPSGSSSSSESTGTRSTGRSPGKGSTRSV